MFIEIYSKPSCIWCSRAKDFLDKKAFGYRDYLIGSNISREEVIEMFPQARTVPIIVVDGVWIGGYDQLVDLLGETKKNS